MRIPFFILFLCCYSIFGQKKTIKGNVVDLKTGKQVSNANIVLLSEIDSIYIKSTTSNKNGNFTISFNKKENFILRCSHIGYYDQYLTLNSRSLLKFKLSPIENIIDEVIIKSKNNKLITFEGNRIIYNTQEDIGITGGNATDVMRRVPLVSIDLEGKLQVKGQSVNLLIDGKPIALGRNTKDVLNSINAQSIKKIEVMTNPSSKFDAEGGGGIVNIITKKGIAKGISNSSELTIGTIGKKLSSNFSYQKKKISVNFDLSGSLYKYKAEGFKKIQINDIGNINQTSKGNIATKAYSSNFNLGYEQDSLSKLEYNLDYNYYLFNYSYYLDQLQSNKEAHIINKGLVEIKVPSTTLKMTLSHSFQPKGKIKEIYNYATYTNDQIPGDFSFLRKEDNFKLKSHTIGKNDEITFGNDTSTDLGKKNKHNLKFGTKGIFRSFYSLYTNKTNNQQSVFELNQNIISGYGEGEIKKGIKWSFRTGLRGEYFWQNRNDSEVKSNTHYFILFPNIEATYNSSPDESFSVAYSKRISRPSIFYLNPNNNEVDPSISYQGNGLLNPEIHHNFEFTYGTYIRNNYLRINPYMRYTKNSIKSIIFFSNESGLVSKYENIKRNLFYGMNLWTSLFLSQKWKIYVNLDGGYQFFKDPSLLIEKHGYEINGTLNNVVDLKKDWNIQGFIGFNSPKIIPQGSSNFTVYSSISIAKKLLNKKLVVILKANNALKNRFLLKNKIRAPNFNFNQGVYFYNRSIEVSLKYGFGDSKKRKAKQRKPSTNDLKKSRLYSKSNK